MKGLKILEKFNLRRVGLVALLMPLGYWFINLNHNYPNRFGFPLYRYYISQAFTQTQAPNVVTAIYLYYRYYDTLFEALLLLFSVIAVIYLSVHEDREGLFSRMDVRVAIHSEDLLPLHSELVARTLAMLYPFILIAGAYITLNGHVSPGGGFQGGAVLAAIFMTKYLTMPIHWVSTQRFQLIEKWMALGIVTIPILLFFFGLHSLAPNQFPYYYVLMNVLISIKVTSGLTVIFLRFIFFETKEF